MTILAVTGLKREAQIVGTRGVVAVAAGSASLDERLAALHGDIRGVISIGLGGALSPLLKVGDVVIGEKIVEAGEGGKQYICDRSWRVALAARLADAHQGPVMGSDAVIADAAQKAALFDASGALAVDMESHAAARFAEARGLPFAALRVISDDSGHGLPPAALVAMKPDGGIATGQILLSLVANPLQLPALLRTARTSRRAFAALLRCRDLCGIGLASPYL